MLAHTCPLLPTHLSHILVSLLVPFHNLAALVFPFLNRRRAVPKKASYPLRLPLHPVAHTLIHTYLPLTTLLPDNPFSLSPAHRLLESLPSPPPLLLQLCSSLGAASVAAHHIAAQNHRFCGSDSTIH